MNSLIVHLLLKELCSPSNIESWLVLFSAVGDLIKLVLLFP